MLYVSNCGKLTTTDDTWEVKPTRIKKRICIHPLFFYTSNVPSFSLKAHVTKESESVIEHVTLDDDEFIYTRTLIGTAPFW